MKTEAEKLIDILENDNINNTNIEDTVIVKTIQEYIPNQNCESAAYGYLRAIAHILYYRPHLKKELLKKFLEPLYYIGIEKASEVFSFTDNLLHDQKLRNIYKPTLETDKWIKGKLRTKQKLIHQLLSEIKQEG